MRSSAYKNDKNIRITIKIKKKFIDLLRKRSIKLEMLEKIIQIHNFKEVLMNQSNLKNMVVLKNLPSNIVEEAIVILKANKKVKRAKKIEKNKRTENLVAEKRENDYILKEAEMLVSNYISGLEEKKDIRKTNHKKMNQKYKRMKNYAYLSSLIILIESVLLMIK